MGKRKNRLKAWLTRTLEIPPDVMMDLPRITMVGRLHIYIENHKGLLLFSDQEVRLMLKQGQCIISGKNFVIKTILPEEILLEGKIDEVRYIDS
ncbi:sporulation protein YqfC [Bacillus altitudinis]|uniref:sporulation protein YqfC n=1 Tax=Bacillus altitudinis TaxID=293387 RepID=UPI0015BCC261|nr:sporulation protein YqfC [Bacillus altitudinis]